MRGGGSGGHELLCWVEEAGEVCSKGPKEGKFLGILAPAGSALM